MTISDIRRSTARLLAAKVGGQAEFARKVGMSDSQVSQLLGEKPAKNIGNMIARRFEAAFGAKEGWLDSVRTEDEVAQLLPSQPRMTVVRPAAERETHPPPLFYIDPIEVEIINSFRQATTTGKLSIRAAAAAAEKVSALGVGNQS